MSSTRPPGGQDSRKQRRELAREQRLAAQAERVSAEARRRRLTMLAGVLVLAAAVVAVAIVLSNGGATRPAGNAGAVSSLGQRTSPTSGAAAGTDATSSLVSRQLAGLSQSANQLGRASAPVTITEYADLECPICQEFTLGSFQTLVAGDIRAGRVKIVYEDLQTATTDANVFASQQVAARAAGRQNKEWQYIELFYRNQGQEGSDYVTEPFLVGLAKLVPGLDLAAWQSARIDPTLAQQVQASAAQAQTLGLSSTPSLVIQGRKGHKTIVGTPGSAQLEQAISSVS